MLIMDASSYSTSGMESKSGYETRESSEPENGSTASKLYLAYTKTHGATNAPLQQLEWNYALPCAHLENLPASSDPSIKAQFYKFERGYYQNECERADERYEDVSEQLSVLPNELEIQRLSGVWTTL